VTQLAKIAEIRDRLPNLRIVIVMDPPPPRNSGNARPRASPRWARSRCRRFASGGRRHRPEELAARRDAVRPEDPYTFIYTSGTTGNPKGACSPTATTAQSSR